MTQFSSAVDVSGLRNSGMLVVREAQDVLAERTFIVIGVARGGTTMVATALHEMGVHMGDRLSAVHEDLEVCGPMEADDVAGLREVIARRDAAYPKWGFKRPGASSYIRKFESEFRNPNYLIVFRDILALTNRNRLSVGQDALAGICMAARQYVSLAELSAALDAPTLLISYEKALLDPAAFAAGLATFAGVDDIARIGRARAAVDPGNDAYLEESRSRRGLGRLDGVSGRRILGWASIQGAHEPVDVRLVINGREVAIVRADRPRADLTRYQPEGKCAFEHILPPDLSLSPGDLLAARIVGEIRDLGNSPLTIRVPSPRPAVASARTPTAPPSTGPTGAGE